MRKYLLIMLVTIFSVSIFPKDNYIFDEVRIKKVFNEYELIESKYAENIWLDLIDRENDIRIQISNYAKAFAKNLLI
ncbi:hypothetical protein [Fusobacterium sp. PH5-44]|uniref:hypothetical protein n=1 Tax=unclassified Fusobacterium TaxID=2648384 RepID=UPI003D1F6B5C